MFEIKIDTDGNMSGIIYQNKTKGNWIHLDNFFQVGLFLDRIK